MDRSLLVLFNDQLVGRIEETRNLWAFRYNETWLNRQSSFDLSPDLPRKEQYIADGATVRPVQWFFDNLLPEEHARELLAKGKTFNAADSFAMLEYYGHESAGALTLLAEGSVIAGGGCEPLEYAELSRRIKNLPVMPLAAENTKRMSLAGAQHKLPVIYQGKKLFEPIGSTLSTHILKPDHPLIDQYPHSVANEWFVMQLAGRMGLNVPDTTFLRIPQPIYLCERFDRFATYDGRLLRQHTLDGCQLLTIPGHGKYAACTVENMNRLIALCRNKASTRQILFRWMAFNVLIGNGDCHLKNLSIFSRTEGISLTPHYDLVCTTVYEGPGQWGNAQLTWPIGDAKYFHEVTPKDFHAFGSAIGLNVRFIEQALTSMATKMLDEAKALYEEVASAEGDGRPSAGEMRHLRQIVFGVINDMVKQFS